MIYEPIQRSIATREGVVLRGDECGARDSPVIVLLSGGGQTRRSWTRVLPLLAARGFRAISYDTRGHGESDWAPDGDYSLPTLAGDLRAIVERQESPVAVVGASLGGLTGLLEAGRRTDGAIRSLVLVDVVPRPSSVGANRIGAFMAAHQDGFSNLETAATTLATFNVGQAGTRDTDNVAKVLRRGHDGRYYWHWDPAFLQFAARPVDSFTSHILSVTQNIRIPTMLVRGMLSDVVDEDGILELKALVPHLEIGEVIDAGHKIVGERNDIFLERLAPFLERTMLSK